VEFCGGTHVANLGEIGMFIITKESGVSAGVRRIEAVVSQSAYRYVKAMQNEMEEAKTAIKSNDLNTGIKKLQEQLKELKAEVKNAQAAVTTEIKAQMTGDVAVIVEDVQGGDIQKMIDEAKAKYPKVAILLIQENDGKVRISAGSQGCAIHAGNWLKAVAEKVGGKGGGRPDFASGGGTNPEGIAEAKAAALEYVKANL
jgi:alanyl-tRNA synthetase